MLKREVDYSRKFEEILKNSRNGGDSDLFEKKTTNN